MAITITQDVKQSIVVIFWVKENSNSPYQGRLEFTQAEFDALTALQLDALEQAQYAAWKAAQTLTADQLTTQEIAANLDSVITVGSEASISLNYSTGLQNIAGIRVVYQTASRIQAVMIGDFLNTLTDAQLRVAFSMTLAQAQALRANKLVPAAAIAASIRSAAGQ